MSRYFDGASEWTEKDKDTSGLPRPFKRISKAYKEKVIDKFTIARIVPIPWQSIPVFSEETGQPLSVNRENEKNLFLQNKCPYCGIEFSDKEKCIRWMIPSKVKRETNALVNSDSFAFHFECMRQARIFCPHMKKTENSEFETGIFVDLRKKCMDELKQEEMKGIKRAG